MNFELYVITDETISGVLSHAEIARRAIDGGADVIQLRDKACGCRELLRIGRALRTITMKTGTLFIINDRLDIALACRADGVHLGQDDIRADLARQIAPPGFIIGISVGTVDEALKAEQDGADYIAISPLFSTGSKNDAGPGLGLDLLREIRRNVTIPVIAIGGIRPDNVRDVIAAGADGVAVISAVVGSRDISAAARELKALVSQSKDAKSKEAQSKEAFR
ncbi:MAG: thiamine phosphate synthase [Methanoregula sp.]|jgi:thiamine-phosphate pyrophosphorylase|nr:thiamine phosphate synthase [Methanoregula sp.]